MMDVGIELLFDGSPGNSITDAGGYAKALEDMGFASLWLPDHVVVFEQYAPHYRYSPDGLPPYGPPQGWVGPLVIVGGQTPAALRRAARLGDGWSSWMLPPDAIADTLAGLDAECEQAGRDPASLRRIHTIFYPGAAAFEEFLERGQKDGVGEVVVVPWVPDRDPFEVLGEIAGIAGRS